MILSVLYTFSKFQVENRKLQYSILLSLFILITIILTWLKPVNEIFSIIIIDLLYSINYIESKKTEYCLSFLIVLPMIVASIFFQNQYFFAAGVISSLFQLTTDSDKNGKLATLLIGIILLMIHIPFGLEISIPLENLLNIATFIITGLILAFSNSGLSTLLIIPVILICKSFNINFSQQSLINLIAIVLSVFTIRNLMSIENLKNTSTNTVAIQKFPLSIYLTMMLFGREDQFIVTVLLFLYLVIPLKVSQYFKAFIFEVSFLIISLGVLSLLNFEVAFVGSLVVAFTVLVWLFRISMVQKSKFASLTTIIKEYRKETITLALLTIYISLIASKFIYNLYWPGIIITLVIGLKIYIFSEMNKHEIVFLDKLLVAFEHSPFIITSKREKCVESKQISKESKSLNDFISVAIIRDRIETVGTMFYIILFSVITLFIATVIKL